MSFELRVKNGKLRASSSEPRPPSLDLRASSYELSN